MLAREANRFAGHINNGGRPIRRVKRATFSLISLSWSLTVFSQIDLLLQATQTRLRLDLHRRSAGE